MIGDTKALPFVAQASPSLEEHSMYSAGKVQQIGALASQRFETQNKSPAKRCPSLAWRCGQRNGMASHREVMQ